MDYFRKYLGTTPGAGQPSGADTVEKLNDRVQSSTLLDDRRDAVRALKSLSKKYRLEVGTQSMETLIQVLQTDRADPEIMGYALDTLCNVMSNEMFPEDGESIPEHYPEDLGGQFTEIFIKNMDNTHLLLSLLEEYDFHIRWPTVKLLIILLTNRSKDLQEAILVSPMGVSKMMDLLSDSREIIRNDGLLLLNHLTKGNANIQKIVAFENAFERLLDIISMEDNSDGGIVVEDCLLLLLNLLKNNSSNQTFFKEGSFIHKLTPFFELQPVEQSPQGGWSAQKVTNLHLMLQVVRTLVAPSNPHQQTVICQNVMNKCRLLHQLCSILMASGVPADVLTETINTVSEVIRGNSSNQEYFASVMAPSTPPRPAIVVLLMSMVNEKQPFVLRCAVLYCFQSFLFKNELGQSQIVQTLLPSTADVNTISAGQLLCGGLFSPDPLSNWCAAVALLHAILENSKEKEQLLRVQLATSIGNPPVSLLQQCMNLLAQGPRFQTRVGLLMLLSIWTAGCPAATTHFLTNMANVPFLISQISASDGDEQEMLVQGLCAFLLGIAVHYNNDDVEGYTKDSLRQVIEKRIGLEMFTDKLGQVPKFEGYTKAAKRPNVHYKQSNEVIFDYEFTRIFKYLENDILKSVSSIQDESPVKNTNFEAHDNIVLQYKSLIRDQDVELCKVRGEVNILRSQYDTAQKKIDEMSEQVQQLKDQNSLLKVRSGGTQSQVEITKEAGEEIAKLKTELEDKNKLVTENNATVEKLKEELTIAAAQALANSSSDGSQPEPNESAMLQATIHRLQSDLGEVNAKLKLREEEVNQLNTKLAETNKSLTEEGAATPERATGSDGEAAAARVAELESRLSSLEESNKTTTSERDSLQVQLQKSTQESNAIRETLKKSEKSQSSFSEEKKQIEEDRDTLKKEQEDLLVLLADQDLKMKSYRSKLKELGHKFDDDDDDDDEEDDDIDVDLEDELEED
ncbi:general vesicular transport factor p115-like isoform X2 [Lineus longissimus]|uniref:general vesicular transport factor p115-like isoform X2 n=1 Tax=Lineus longissimus TaxID=88925 RepID=UPI00315D00C4